MINKSQEMGYTLGTTLEHQLILIKKAYGKYRHPHVSGSCFHSCFPLSSCTVKG